MLMVFSLLVFCCALTVAKQLIHRDGIINVALTEVTLSVYLPAQLCFMRSKWAALIFSRSLQSCFIRIGGSYWLRSKALLAGVLFIFTVMAAQLPTGGRRYASALHMDQLSFDLTQLRSFISCTVLFLIVGSNRTLSRQVYQFLPREITICLDHLRLSYLCLSGISTLLRRVGGLHRH